MSILKNLKNLASDSLIYGVSGIFTRFVGIFLTPIYARVYSPSDYGVIGVITNGYLLISIFLVFAFDNSTARWFYDTESVFRRKRIINTWIWFYLTASLVCMIFLILTSEFWVEVLLPEYPESKIYIKLLAASLPFLVWPTVAINVLRFERKATHSVTMSLIQSGALICFNLIFVVLLRYGVIGVYYAQLLASLIIMPLSIYFIRDWIGLPKLFNKALFKEMFRFSLPIVPAGLSYWVVNLSGIYFVNELLQKSEVGLYQIGISIAAVAGLATSAFQQAWSPFSFSILNQPNSKSVFAASLNLYVLGVGLLCTFISIFSFEALVILTTPEYYDAAVVASILTFNYFLMGLSNISGLGAAIAKKTTPLGVVSVVSSVILVALNLLLIPKFGKEGAAIAICFAQILIPLYMFWKSGKLYHIPYNYWKNIGVVLGMVSCVLLAFQLPEMPFLTLIAAKSGIFLAGLLVLAYFNKQELHRIHVLVKDRYVIKS